MKRNIYALSVTILFVLSLATLRPALAASGDYVHVTYAGGALCDSTGLVIPVNIDLNFASAATLTETVTVTGVVLASGTYTIPAGHAVYPGAFGGSFSSNVSVPYDIHDVTHFNNEFTVVINGVCTAGGFVVVSIADTRVGGPSLPPSFVLRTIICNTPVYDEPGGQALSSGAALKAGQTWYVNPTPVKGKDGKKWTEYFSAGPINAYIPTSCVG